MKAPKLLLCASACGLGQPHQVGGSTKKLADTEGFRVLCCVRRTCLAHHTTGRERRPLRTTPHPRHVLRTPHHTLNPAAPCREQQRVPSGRLVHVVECVEIHESGLLAALSRLLSCRDAPLHCRSKLSVLHFFDRMAVYATATRAACFPSVLVSVCFAERNQRAAPKHFVADLARCYTWTAMLLEIAILLISGTSASMSRVDAPAIIDTGRGPSR